MSLPKKNGFTLVELLVVMAIIGILAAISIVSFQTSQTKARDAQRKSDLNQIGQTLEAYYNDKGQYPDNSAATFKIDGCEDSGSGPDTCEWGAEWSDENDTIYMILLPADTSASLNYYYLSDGSYYQLYARLQNNLDGEIPTLSGNPANYSISCGALNCNYGIASSNKTVGDGRTVAAD